MVETLKKRRFFDDNWFRLYAIETLRLKEIDYKDENKVIEETKSIKNAFQTVYRAVAFDIDGTLTTKDFTTLDTNMISAIRHLLIRSVPVILITGRGRTSAREAALEIVGTDFFPSWYARRLFCVTHNGVFLLSTATDDPKNFFNKEEIFVKFFEIESAELLITKRLKDFDVKIMREPQSIRIVLNETTDKDQVLDRLKVIINTELGSTQKLYLSTGRWAKQQCYDIAPSNKQIALKRCSEELGIPEERILRIGDQGHTAGNDFGLLSSNAGFCVGPISTKVGECHPVLLGDPPTRNGQGVIATKALLKELLLFSSLSISPQNPKKHLKKLRWFEGSALIRARKEGEMFQNRLRLRLKHIIEDDDEIIKSSEIQISDIYDMNSGAIRFRDWEINQIEQACPFAKLFNIMELVETKNSDFPQGHYSMFTDTGIILRGPFYYFSMVNKNDKNLISNYMDDVFKFLKKSKKCMENLDEFEPNLVIYKFLLGILDNVRNILLKLFYMCSASANLVNDRVPFEIAKELLIKALNPHTEYYYGMLINPDADWFNQILKYKKLLQQITKVCEKFSEAEKNGKIAKKMGNDKITLRKWRENDNIIENIIAVQLGLHQLYQLEEVRKCKSMYFAGLMYGGTELPILGEIIAKHRGFSAKQMFLKLSLYSDKNLGKKVREGNHHYVSEMLLKKPPMLIPGEPKKKDFFDDGIIIMDDNCTTSTTLQLARDFLALMGADIFGAVIVRFPGFNRSMQMTTPGYGLPEPDILFSFVRGLVARSPYSRLLYPPKKLKDCTGVFDKSRGRIERFLVKNGTPPMGN